jgi:hypothetical protein
VKQEKYRRRYLVNTRYQLTQAGVAIAANLMVALLMAAMMSWFYLLYLESGIVANHNQLFPIYLAVASLIVLVISTFWSLRRSRIVAGMMRKLDIILRDAAGGIFPEKPLVFRKGDYFGWLAQPINDCFLQLKKQRRIHDSTVVALDELKTRIVAGEVNNEGIVRKIDEILAGLTTAGKSEKE